MFFLHLYKTCWPGALCLNQICSDIPLILLVPCDFGPVWMLSVANRRSTLYFSGGVRLCSVYRNHGPELDGYRHLAAEFLCSLPTLQFCHHLKTIIFSLAWHFWLLPKHLWALWDLWLATLKGTVILKPGTVSKGLKRNVRFNVVSPVRTVL